MPNSVVGRSVPRKEALEKVTGRARYIDDLRFPGMLHGVTVRSAGPRGLIRNIDYGAGVPWSEYTIVSARDIPGANCISLILDDQPCLAADRVNHPEEPVVLLAHPDRHRLEAARRAIAIELDPLPGVFTLDESLAAQTVVWGRDNVFQEFLVDKGDTDAAWAGAAFIVEGEYRTGAQEQLYIEPQGMIAIANPGDGVTVWGSMQCPFYVHKALMKVFALPADKVRVIQSETGGGFGGKEEYPSMIAAHAALLAWKSGRPVKLIYDRHEDMAATTKRHPSRTRHRTAVTRDGKLLAMDVEFVIDGGAYATLSKVVLSRGTIHAAGPYFCPNVRIRARAVATTTPPYGAFRGFGAPQSLFALECHLDEVARAAGLPAGELRRRNFLEQGLTTSTGQVITERVALGELMDRAFALSRYHEKRERFARENAAHPARRRGIGFAAFYHGAGFTGSGERYLASTVGVEATAEGRVRILAAATEIGQGANTVLAQIAADALSIPYDAVDIATPDTAGVPDSGPTVASRTAMVVGKLVESAALGLRQTLVAGGFPGEFAAAARDYVARFGALRCYSRYEAPPGIHWDDDHYRGDAYGAFAWAVYVAEVAVDMLTYETEVEDFVAVQDVGTVIHPVLAAGQVVGGVVQGIGYALYEQVVLKEGRMVNNQMTNYIVPTTRDVPPIRVDFRETPYPYGPSGAKGLGELPMDGPAPAILNAMENAVGQRLHTLPATPEALLESLESAHHA